MSEIRIQGGRRLSGSLRVQGAKNSVLPIIAAALLVRGVTVLHNCPQIRDVDTAIEILRHLGCSVTRCSDAVIIDASSVSGSEIPDRLMRQMRSSVVFLGAILSRTGEAKLSMPGGCELGPRPIDLHLAALRTLGFSVREEGGNICCRAARPRGARIDLAIPSVGATENGMLAAVSCTGETFLTNAAREPEIRDLASFLRAAGAEIRGDGTSVIWIRGPVTARRAEHTVIPDRIAAATYLAAAASAGGEILLTGVEPEHLRAVTDTLSGMGCEIRRGEDSLRFRADGPLHSCGTVSTGPYPAFPTDAQPPVAAASLQCRGTAVFVENMFENRFRYAPELRRMGADLRVEGRVAIVTGGRRLHGAPVEATDLRGGAALAVAALGAEGTTRITGIEHILRGYQSLTGDLRTLGADITEE